MIPPNKLVIHEITAFVSVDETGNEGVMAALLGGVYMPLICADEERIKQMFLIAEQICERSSIPFKVLRFSTREDVTADTRKRYSPKPKMP